MTIDEALEIVSQTEGCWVVFNSETGEVLSVAGDSPDETAQDRFAHLGTLSTFNQPVKTRYFQSAGVTREVLQREQGESVRVRTRVRVLTEWSKATTEELLQVLERGQYDDPMSKDFDSRVIVDHLWELHRDDLTDSVQERFKALLGSTLLCGAAVNKLNIYSAALSGDEERLKAIWMGTESGRGCWADAFALMDALAYVHTQDQAVIADIVKVLDTDMPFGGKYDTMIALGKIGPVAGTSAVDLIRKAIHDSQPWVIAARDRVLARLESSEDARTRCDGCCYGRCHDEEGHGERACSLCLGIGYLPASLENTEVRRL